jgi:hypothetical protein
MTDDMPDITEPRTFVTYGILMLIFGTVIGIGAHITFSGLHLTTDQGIAIFVIIFITGFVIAVAVREIKNRIGERE